MAENAFKVGDVVQLKSGGPDMTVNGLFGGEVICAWFVGNDVKTETFNQGALKLVRGAA